MTRGPEDRQRAGRRRSVASAGTTEPPTDDDVDGERRPPVSTAFLLMTLGRRVRAEIEDGLRAEGISLRHLSALGHLSPDPGLSYSELARRAGITPQSMQATLNALEARGAVVRVTDPGRGRTAELRITAEGDRLRRAGRQVIAAVDDGLREQLSNEAFGALTAAVWTLLPPPGEEGSTAGPAPGVG